MLLQPNDVVLLFNNNEFNDSRYVEIFGEIRKPGKNSKVWWNDTAGSNISFWWLKTYCRILAVLKLQVFVNIDSAQVGLKPTETTSQYYSINSDLTIDTAAANVVFEAI